MKRNQNLYNGLLAEIYVCSLFEKSAEAERVLEKLDPCINLKNKFAQHPSQRFLKLKQVISLIDFFNKIACLV